MESLSLISQFSTKHAKIECQHILNLWDSELKLRKLTSCLCENRFRKVLVCFLQSNENVLPAHSAEGHFCLGKHGYDSLFA